MPDHNRDSRDEPEYRDAPPRKGDVRDDPRRPAGDHPEHRFNRLSDLKGKSIINLDNGERIGQVDDVMVDPHSLAISGLVVTIGGVFNRESHIIPAAEVDKWGKDAVLVKGGQVFRNQNEMPEYESWLSAQDRLNGLTVVTVSGDRIGQIDDVLIDDRGQIAGYRVSDGPGGFGGSSFDIPAQATRTLGNDVAIVDYDPKTPRE